MKQKPPLRIGEEISIKIEGLNHGGEGVGRYKGFTVFVPYAVPLDLVTARVISLQKNYARALLQSVSQPSYKRVSPLCQHFEKCGGCQLQHLNYAEQLKFKRDIVRNALQRIAHLDVPVLPTIGMEEPWHYRNKSQVPVGLVNNEVRIGFYEKRSHTIVDLKCCPIQHPRNDKVVNTVREALRKNKIPLYDEKKHTGIVRHIIARTSFSNAETLVVIVTNSRSLPYAEQLIQSLQENIPGLCGVVQNINTRRVNTIMGQENITLWGRSYLIESIADLKFHISPHSFFQVNPIQTGALYQKAKEYAGLTGSETVFDIYCGIGTIALYLARFSKKVIGVESVEAAVKDARQNAELNNTKNVEFFTGLAEEVVAKLIESGYQADVVIVDPPRKGCDQKLLSAMSEMQPDRIVYISCNPATLARDLKYLSEHGYESMEAQPIDMFPQTSHVETVVLMSRL
ncbi:MAG: 23S rRNA (uracil(1939)-C(5))-methyltransferase RlmD [Firmicutes bacterium]|nr:23S rRNA (uracil(1939)-C(5))-methyltransferase RlmD [Bacillota bacterium]